MNKFFHNMQSKLIVIAFVLLVAYWSWINLSGLRDETHNYIFGLFLGLFTFLGGVIAFPLAKRWDFLHSVVGRAVSFLAFGLCTWGIGTLIFAYYNLILQVEVPYPSIADLAYVVSWPLWGYGLWNLGKATGVKYGLRHATGKTLVIFVPVATVLISYYLLVVVARGGEITTADSGLLKTILDFAYPLGDIILLTVTALLYSLSYKFLGGVFHRAINMIIVGFILNYLADFSFSYTTTVETFYVANWVDLLFLTTMFVLSLGVNLFDARVLNNLGKNDVP